MIPKIVICNLKNRNRKRETERQRARERERERERERVLPALWTPLLAVLPGPLV